MTNYSNAVAKFTIGSLDSTDLEVDAQYNPHELQIDQQLGWSSLRPGPKDRKVEPLEQTHVQPETMKVDLLFDGVEKNGAIDNNTVTTVHQAIENLRRMARPEHIIKNATDARRSHFCVAMWGDGTKGMPRFECVIESISVKYTQFSSNGDVLRATVTLGLKAARRLGDDAAKTDSAARHARSNDRRAMARDAEGTTRLRKAGFEAE